MRFYAHVQIFRTKIEKKNRVAILFCTIFRKLIQNDSENKNYCDIKMFKLKFAPSCVFCSVNLKFNLGILIL
jgi:hypothetical protein